MKKNVIFTGRGLLTKADFIFNKEARASLLI